MISQNEIQPVDKFIEKALYDKKIGYYSKFNPFGKKGDFVTAPLISPLFSEMIAVWVISFWIKLGKPNKFSFVELGPGNGAFCKTFCRVLKNFPELKDQKICWKKCKAYKNTKNLINDENVFWLKV